ncbi:hypothetical protein CCP4SC76_3330002 [Gammaproteobacteria bacterium]
MSSLRSSRMASFLLDLKSSESFADGFLAHRVFLSPREVAMAIQFINTDKPSSHVTERPDRPHASADIQNSPQSQSTDAPAQGTHQASDQAALGRAQQLLSAESPRPSVGTPIHSQKEARSVVARLKEQFQRQPELALSSLASGLGARASALLEAAPMAS